MLMAGTVKAAGSSRAPARRVEALDRGRVDAGGAGLLEHRGAGRVAQLGAAEHAGPDEPVEGLTVAGRERGGGVTDLFEVPEFHALPAFPRARRSRPARPGPRRFGSVDGWMRRSIARCADGLPQARAGARARLTPRGRAAVIAAAPQSRRRPRVDVPADERPEPPATPPRSVETEVGPGDDEGLVWAALARWRAERRRFALLTVVETHGSAPRKAGTHLLLAAGRGERGHAGRRGDRVRGAGPGARGPRARAAPCSSTGTWAAISACAAEAR